MLSVTTLLNKTNMKNILLLLTFSISYLLTSYAQTPAKPQQRLIILLNGTAHIGNGTVIEKSAIGFENGEILFVSNAKDYTRQLGDEVIDITGKQVYPGFIAPSTTLGLVEIEAVRATRDFEDVGSVNPHVRSEVSYNTDSKITPTIRTNGVLLAQVAPRGGLISGTSSVFTLDGWNWEDAVYKTDDGIFVNWPARYSAGGWWGEPEPMKKNEEYEKRIAVLQKFFADAKAYSEKGQNELDIRMEAMKGVFTGEKRLFINATLAKDIIEAVYFAKNFAVPHLVIVGAKDASLVTDVLKNNNVAVILDRVHDLPSSPDRDIDQPFRTPKLLQDAGVLYCLSYLGGMETAGMRNLPFTAGTAVAYGLTKEQALSAITLNTAKILGIDDKAGTLESGKDATLFVSSGDALDMRTNNLEIAFIKGKKLDLDNYQKQLYRKFRNKYTAK
jgi:imidazolonepropionase-like amidohydrolase